MKNIFIDGNFEDEIDYSKEVDLKDNDIYTNLSEDDNSSINNSVDNQKNTIVVEIKGEVLNPDVYILDEGSIIKDLIEAAGGLTGQADISNINRAKAINNHELIIIRNINDFNLEEDTNFVNESTINNNNEELININTADISRLKEIPGIGEVKAKAIMDYRQKQGGFKSIEEIKNVDGIGEKTFENLKELIKI